MPLTGLNTRITWNDFTEKASAPAGEDAQAYTSAQTRASFAFARADGGGLKLGSIVVSVSMVRRESWVVRGTKTPALLQHEQEHYSITAIGGRDVFRRLGELTGSTSAELQQAANDIQSEVQSLTDQANEEYDRDSEHSRNEAGQQNWSGAIRCVLANPNGSLNDLVTNLSSACGE